MSNNFTMGVGQAHELEMAMVRVGGWDPALVKKLSTGGNLARVRDVLLGHAVIIASDISIDCDADPFVPEGWSVVEHRKGGIVKCNPANVALYLSERQQNGKWIEGNKLRRELSNKPVLNANVLDRLLAHPHLIPEEWKNKRVFFWGTVYRDSGGDLYVRYLYWYGDRWHWNYRWLDRSWSGRSPAAVRAS